MIFFQGSWYCTCCGWDYDYIPKDRKCIHCDGEQFQGFPMVPPSDEDQLTEKEIKDLDLSIGIF